MNSPTQPHEFTEDVNDGSMCVCGIPALTHDQVVSPTQPDPLDDHAPDWLVELLGEHVYSQRMTTNSGVPFRMWWECGCGWQAVDGDVDHRAHVAAAVWAELTGRVGRVLDGNSAPYLLDALGADHD